jgi:hypothetical protein
MSKEGKKNRVSVGKFRMQTRSKRSARVLRRLAERENKKNNNQN